MGVPRWAWEAAGLDPCDASWGTRQAYTDVRCRLLNTAGRVVLRGSQPLAGQLYIPPLYQPALKNERNAAYEEFVTQMEPRRGRAPYRYFLGVLAETREGRGGGLPLGEPQPRTPLLAQASRKTQRGWLKVRDAVLLSTPHG